MSTIPKKVWLYWHTSDLPDAMKQNLERLQQQNPEFTYTLFNEETAASYLRKNFPIEVLQAYNSLIPIAYKCDLFRYCILYKLGGIYLDVKIQCENNFKLVTLTNREHYCDDGEFVDEHKTMYKSLTNGFLFMKPGNEVMLNCIANIIFNVCTQFYGVSPWHVSGPQMLGKNYVLSSVPKLHYALWHKNCLIYNNAKLAFSFYKEYRNENKAVNYVDAWHKQKVYAANSMNLADVIMKKKEWPEDLNSALEIIIKRQNFSLETKQPVKNSIRLHLFAVPHTITRSEFSHDAFTGKVQRFSPMMRSRGFEVFHYGNEGSESGANQDFQIFNKEEWQKYRVMSMMHLHKELTEEEAIKRLENPKSFVGDLANWSTPLYEEFNRRLKPLLKENYRSKQTDIVCIPLGHTYDAAIQGENYNVIETGIGYSGSCKEYRIFESHCWLSRTLGKEDRNPPNYWFVIPNYYDIEEFPFSPSPIKNRIGFLGRITDVKGCNIIVEVAKRFPHVEFVLCGQGNPTAFLKEPNIHYKPPIHGKERGEYLGSCAALLTLSKYLEPFCGVNVEAQLCGTPVISHDFGAMVETVEQFKTGLRCHTLGEICLGIKMALEGKFDRQYIRTRACEMFDMYNIAHKYEYVFKTILEISSPNNGWYSPENHMHCLMPKEESRRLNIALLLQGSVKHIEKTLPNFKRYVQCSNNMDIFLGHNKELCEDLKAFQSKCDPIEIVDEPIRYYHDYTKYPGLRTDTNLHFMLTRFINRKNVFQAFENHCLRTNRKYDFVVSCFANAEIHSFIQFDCLPSDEEIVFIPKGDDWNGLNYLIAYGTPSSMKKYMEMYNNLIHLLEMGSIPHPETLMKRHVEDISLRVVRSAVQYKHVH